MRFTEETSLPRVDSLQQDQLGHSGPAAITHVAEVVVPPGIVFHSGTPPALDDRMIVLGGERITQFSSNLAMVAMPVSARCCAHPIRRRPRRA